MDRCRRGREVLDARACRASLARRSGRADLLLRRPQRLSTSHRSDLSQDGRADLHRASGPLLAVVCGLAASQGRRRGSPLDLHRQRSHRVPCARRIRTAVGLALSDDRAQLAFVVVAPHRLPRVPPRAAAHGLHDQRDRIAQLPATKIIKTKGHFPDADAATKLLFLALRNVEKCWNRGIKGWSAIYNQLVVYFGAERLNLETRGANRAQNS